MAFHEVRFPDDISRGARGGPERRTQIVELASGDEERNASWANSRRRYDVAYGIRRADDLAAVVAFFEARNGRLYGFRFKDWGDYKSCIPSQTPDPTDQMIGAGDGAMTEFQLVREPELKAMSESGELANYRILHFATHGLLSGDVERMAKRQGEPALVLTPPDEPVDEDDDGLLMASEVATLKLNADWIVLSACNTAAGDDIGAEALSGLARAFFYAGAKTLLVSHWPVYSDAAVRLTTRAFAELDGNPKAGRAEALQQAMIALMDDPSQADNVHPAVWAPFVVVGEGAR